LLKVWNMAVRGPTILIVTAVINYL